LRNRRGVTLVELVILLVIAAIVLPGLMMYFVESMNHSADAQMETVGLGLAQELMEEIKAKRWDQNIPIPDGVYSAIGPEAGESRCDPAVVGCTSYNDIDDYHGLNNTPPQDPQGNALPSTYSGYREQVSVCYVNGPQSVSGGGNNADAGACVAGLTTTDYKKITVTVTWGANGRVQLDTVMTNYHLTS
jgi:MSHA pilin protein MshD